MYNNCKYLYHLEAPVPVYVCVEMNKLVIYLLIDSFMVKLYCSKFGRRGKTVNHSWRQLQLNCKFRFTGTNKLLLRSTLSDTDSTGRLIDFQNMFIWPE